MSREISNSDDIIDSRDVIARIEELEEEREEFLDSRVGDRGEEHEASIDDAHDAALDLEDWEAESGAELRALKSLADEAEGYASDWHHGETLVRDSYFEEYAQELAEECGMLEGADKWPLTCIDWEQAARELQQDYTAVEWDGVTYWVR